MCNLPHYRLVDSSNAIWDMPEVEVLSNGTDFLGSQVWHMSILEGAMRKIDV